MRQGDKKTERSGQVHVEVGPGGEVVCVSYCGQPIPFTYGRVREARAEEARRLHPALARPIATIEFAERESAMRGRCPECEGTAGAPKFTRRNDLFPPALCKNRFHYGEKKA